MNAILILTHVLEYEDAATAQSVVFAGGARLLVRPDYRPPGREPRREILLRFGIVLRQDGLPHARASCVHAQELPDGFKVREIAGHEELPLLRLFERGPN
jgi:hypothetical protein